MRLFGHAVLVAGLSGCATALSPEAQLAECSPQTAPRVTGYILEDGLGGYSRRFIPPGQPEFSVDPGQQEFSVDENGEIYLPLLGKVTPIITVIESGSVYVLGEVMQPGAVPYNQGMTVRQAITKAGEFTYLANKYDIRIQRGKCDVKINVDAPVRPHDVISVAERLF